ncbi:MAG: tRNA1(Val) (adenine(37)-N6)-methyltransferase [Treponema sp.]|nr:tRNA1(Val) (adenine(37)-N6)-methyltransferase [Treponema sp.]
MAEQTDLLLNGYQIIQDSELFMFGIDAVLLADFCKNSLKPKDSLIDLCTGNGIIPLLLAKNGASIKALEIQEQSANLAKRSVQLNNLENKIEIVQGDVKNVQNLFPKHFFNVVTCNPPYMINEHGRQNPADVKAIARHEVLCNLEDIVSAADYLLATHGRFFMIHRPFRLPEIFTTLAKFNLEPKTMRLIKPFENTEPNLVLIEARKNANPRLKILPELTVYETPGNYTTEINDIYNRIKN